MTITQKMEEAAVRLVAYASRIEKWKSSDPQHFAIGQVDRLGELLDDCMRYLIEGLHPDRDQAEFDSVEAPF